MNREPAADFFAVWPQHIPIHDQLLEWALYVSSRRGGKKSQHPMWRTFVGHGGAGDECSQHIDPIKAHATEKAVCALPFKHQQALKWHYVEYWVKPLVMCKHLAVSRQGLALLIHDGRSMLVNRGR